MSAQCFECIQLKKKFPLKVVFTTEYVKILLRHIKLKHPYITVYNCTFCPLKTSVKFVYSRHMQRHIDRNHVETNQNPIIPNNLPQIEVDNFEDQIVLENNNENLQANEENIIANLDEYSDEIELGACRYMLALLNNSDFTMKKALRAINTVDSFMTPIQNFIFRNLKFIPYKGDKNRFENLCQNPFTEIKTQYKFLKYLERKNLYRNPTKYKLRTTKQLKTRKGTTNLEDVDHFLVLMSVPFMIKKFLELPGIYTKMMEKMENLLKNENNITHFVQGEKWRKIIEQNPGKKCIPIFLYNDDFAVGNQQGIKAANHGLSVVNIHFPLMDDWDLSKLEFLFPAAFVKASYTKGGIKTLCLINLRDILKDMAETGIEIIIDNEPITVYIILGAIIGDNLAVHQMLDFSSGFMHEYMCRICLMDKHTRNTAVVDNPSLHRTLDHYNLNKNNPRYGYIRNCPFNLIPSFHVLQNYSADLMHDIFEGIAIYGMQAALDDFIREGFFTAEEFSKILDTFSYGEIDSNNKLSSDNFKNGKLYLTASQSMLLVKFLPLLVCHRVTSSNPTFKYLIILEKLCNLCMCKNFTEARLKELENLIKKHHTMYIKFKIIKIDPITGEETIEFVKLKPKHHIVTHYILCIRKNGPLIYMWTMRHEGLNKYMKMYTYASTSRINLSFSLAKKFQMMFAHFLDKYETVGPPSQVEFTNNVNFNLNKKDYKDDFDFPFPVDNISLSYNKIRFKGTEYKLGYFILILDKCYKIIDIISTNSNNFFVVLKEYLYQEKVELNYFLLGDETTNFSLKSINYLGVPFNIITLQNRKKIFKFNKYRIMYK